MSAATNGERTVTLDTLLNRKLHLAEGLSCRDLFTQLTQADEQIAALSRSHSEERRRLDVARAATEEAAQVAGLEVEGKNEVERKARRALALRQDAGYIAAVTAERMAESRLSQIELDLDATKRRARRIEREIDYRTSALTFLS